MFSEPDIVRVLRQEEKDGKLVSNFTIGPENQIQFHNLDIDSSKDDNKTFYDLLEIINFTEKISTSLYGDLNRDGIIEIVINEFKKSKYTGSILLLKDDNKTLEIVDTSYKFNNSKNKDSIFGYKIKNFKVNLDKSKIYSQVIKEGKTVNFKIAELLDETLPKRYKVLAKKFFKSDKDNHVATPLIVNGKIIGAFAMSSTMLQNYFIPSVKNLALHISNSFEHAENVIDQEESEKIISKSEQKYRTMIEKAPLGIFTVDTKGTVTSCNDAFIKMAGYSMEELINKNIVNFPTLIKKDIPKYLKMFKSIISGNVPKSFIFNWKNKSGEICTGELFISLIKIENKITGIQAIIKDLSETQEAKLKLRDAEERYNSLFEGSMDLVYICDFKGQFIDANKAALKLLEYNIEDIKNLNFTSLLDIQQQIRAFNVLGEIKKYGHQKSVREFKLKRKNGEYIYVDSYGTLLYRDGEPYAVQGIARDITERKMAEFKIKNRTEELELINLVNNAINSNQNLDYIMDLISKETGNIFNSFNATIYLISKDKKYLKLEKSGLNSKDRKIIQKIVGVDFLNFNIPLNFQSVYLDALEEKKPRLINTDSEILDMISSATDNRLLKKFAPVVLKRLKIKSTMVVPLITDKGCIGLIDISSKNIFNEEDLHRFSSIAQQLTIAIDKIILRESKDISEEKYHDLYERLRDGSASVDMEGKIVEFNSTFKEMLGYSSDEIYNLTFKDITPERWHEKEEEIIREQVLKRGYSDLYEKEYIKKDGTVIPVEITTYLLRNEDGTPQGMWAILREISERKEAERLLKESEEKYKNLVTLANDGIAIIKDNRIDFVNQRMADMVNYDISELLGEEFLKYVSEEEKDNLKLRYQMRMEGKNIPNVYESQLIKKNGDVLSVEINASVIDYNGKQADMAIIRDITERKQMEIELKEAKDHFQTLFNTVIDPVAIVDKKGKILEITDKVVEITGFSRDELVGKNFMLTKFASKKTKAVLVENLIKRMTGIKIPPYEIEILKKTGEIVNVELNAARIDYFGKVADMVVFRDVSERKLAEKSIKESEEKFRNLAEESPNMIFINKKGKVVYANKKCEETMGYRREDFYKSDFNFLDLIAPEYKEMISNNHKKHESGKEILPYEYKLITKEGKRIESIITTKIIKYGGENAILGIITDITDIKKAEQKLKESEENYRNIVELAPDGIITVNTKGVINSCNPAFAKLTGFPVDEIIGKHITKLPTMRKRDIPKYIKLFYTLIRGSKQDSYEFEWIHNDGTTRLAEARAGILKKDNKIIGLQAIIRDITEQKKAEKELNVAHDELKSLNQDLEKKVEERTVEINRLLKQKDDFINQLGHDLKNPLTPVINLLPLIKGKVSDDQTQDQLNIIMRNVDFMKNLVVKTIELAKLNSPNTEFFLEDTNLSDEINSIIEKNKTILQNNNISIVKNLDDDILINTDKLRLNELFDNIITNAVKYSPNGGNIIFNAEDVGEFIKVSVKDSGIGLDKTQKDHIFDEFYKVDKSRHDFDSSGLGLTICKRIVEKHGGRIWVESPGHLKGTTISFTLPKVVKK